MRTTRTATVMFTDLVDSTARATRVGPSRADSMRAEHFDLVRGLVTEHRGTAVKTLGDGVMAMFDSSAGAVDAAVALQQRLHASNRANPDAPELRIGLGVGEVTEEDADVFGQAVVEASRLCSVATPRQILCTALVRNLAEDHCAQTFRPVGALALKGFAQPIAVEEVLWAPLVQPGIQADFARVDEGDAFDAVSFLDRQQESAFFTGVRMAVDQLLAPSPGQVVLDVGCGAGHDALRLATLVGPAGRVVGVDKSATMIEEATGRARAAGMRNVEFHVGDAAALPLPSDSVDGARSDRLFQYLADPAVALAQILRVTRPGGTVVVADTDWGASSFDCDDDELGSRVDGAWTRTRASGRVGRELFALFVRAGFRDVRVHPRTVAVTDIGGGVGGTQDAADSERAYTGWLYRERVLPAFAAQAVDSGAITAEEATRWLTMQRRAAEEGRFFRFLAMFVVAGTVPG